MKIPDPDKRINKIRFSGSGQEEGLTGTGESPRAKMTSKK
jgi:hypothetical protein